MTSLIHGLARRPIIAIVLYGVICAGVVIGVDRMLASHASPHKAGRPAAEALRHRGASQVVGDLRPRAAKAFVAPDAMDGFTADISPQEAEAQAIQVAQARGVPLDQVLVLVRRHTITLSHALISEPRVDVAGLNRDLDECCPTDRPTFPQR